MNAPEPAGTRTAAPLFALALLSLHAPEADPQTSAEARWLDHHRQQQNTSVKDSLQAWLARPPADDQLLHTLARALPLQALEVIAVAMAAAVETNAMAGRVVAWLQSPVGGSRPTLGLVLAAADALGMAGSIGVILEGMAHETGLLRIESDTDAPRRPLCEQTLQVPLPLLLALRDGRSQWPGVTLTRGDPEAAVVSLRDAAARQARALCAGDDALAIRSGHPREARTAAALVAHELGMQAALFDHDPPTGVGLWLELVGAVPVLCRDLAPGETLKLPKFPGYRGPVLMACGPEGSFERDGDTVGSWRVPLPEVAERERLWHAQVGNAATAQRTGAQYRYTSARIQQLGRAAHYHAKLDGEAVIDLRHIHRAARSGVGAELGTLAELMPEHIADEALVIPPALRDALHALCERCALREDLAQSLGTSTRTRYRPGVRSLFVGPSGTGKTLAAGWLATRLGLPLYRVDVASVTSKYIGETEKNLAQLFARAEHAEVVLLFDEADSLFGKRTEVKEANDRFANAQTNYLLQRIESFEGIVVLTSNSRARFDSAFTRRLDKILEFPQPTPDERRSLWAGHLGEHHALSSSDLNRLAAACELAGGHIRNAVLDAAARARHQQRAIAFADVLHAVSAEYRKLGQQTPAALSDSRLGS